MWLHGAGRVSFERDEQLRIQCSPEFQTLRVWSQLPDTMVFPSGEKATEAITLLWALLFSATSSSVAARGQGESVERRYKRVRIQRSPEFQTLRVLSLEPETIVFPSGEKATELIARLCAFVFSLESSSVAVQYAEGRQYTQESGFRPKTHPNSTL